MASKSALRGAFSSLSDTLLWRFDPSAPEDIRSRWLGAIANHASVARRTSEWNALAHECGAYDPVVADLNEATMAIASADTAEETLAALDMANAAVDATGPLLAENPCGQQVA